MHTCIYRENVVEGDSIGRVDYVCEFMLISIDRASGTCAES
jgi:hypothetical protein